MQVVFRDYPLKDDEIHDLVALFEDRAQQGEQNHSVAQLNFSLLGLLGASLLVVLFDVIWRGRLRAVRRSLIHDEEV